MGRGVGRPVGADLVLAGRWEWQWSRPAHAVPASDFIDLLHMLAPIARVTRPTAGVCQVHLETDGAAVPDIYLAARAGSIQPRGSKGREDSEPPQKRSRK
jgi:hypothetical protein